jgi:hypothetical protein
MAPVELPVRFGHLVRERIFKFRNTGRYTERELEFIKYHAFEQERGALPIRERFWPDPEGIASARIGHLKSVASNMCNHITKHTNAFFNDKEKDKKDATPKRSRDISTHPGFVSGSDRQSSTGFTLGWGPGAGPYTSDDALGYHPADEE